MSSPAASLIPKLRLPAWPDLTARLRHVPGMLWGLILAVISGSILFCIFELRVEFVKVGESESELVRHLSKRLEDSLLPARDDLLLMADDPVLRAWVENPGEPAREELGRRLGWWSRHRRQYLRLRVFDLQGREVAAAENRGGIVELVADADLQDKSQQYFFADALRLRRGEVGISHLDLRANAGRVLLPYRPTLRFSTPLFNSSGAMVGVVSLNLDARPFLNEVVSTSAASAGSIQLLNADGYWLVGGGDSDWAFMLPQNKAETFGTRNPWAWQQIAHQWSGSFNKHDDLFTFITASTTALLNASPGLPATSRTHVETWKLVSRVSKARVVRRVLPTVLFTAGVDVLLLLPLGWVSFSFARVRMQEEGTLQEVREQTRVLDLATDAVFIFDRNTRIVRFWNRGAERLFGWPRREVLGRSVDEISQWLQVRLPAPAKQLHFILDRTGCWEGEISHTTRWGQTLTTSTTWALQRNERGEPISVLAINRDITARKRAEIELRSANETTEMLLNAIPSLLISVNEQREIKRWNPAAACIFGLSAEQVQGKTLGGCGVQWVGANPDEQIETSMRDADTATIDNLQFTRDGENHFLAMRMTRLFKGGQPAGMLMVGADTTERMMLEAQLRQAQKLEAIGQLAAGVAHEINTPTQYVGDNTVFLQQSWKSVAQLLELGKELHRRARSGELNEEFLGHFESMNDALDINYLMEEVPRALDQSLEGLQAVAKIVRAMKEFSHPGQEAKKAIDLNHAIETTVTVTRNEWKYVAEMETLFDRELPLVPCLPAELNQVMLNLIVNAAHAIGEAASQHHSSEKGRITIRTSRSNEWAEIAVSDTGCGIPEEHRNRVYDLFFTTKEVGKGTGQGLALAHTVVVQRHGGQIWFETEVGKGTTFHIRLPLEAPECAPSAAREKLSHE